jgi:hypothetical protein
MEGVGNVTSCIAGCGILFKARLGMPTKCCRSANWPASAAVLLQAVLRSQGHEVWEKGDNHKAKLQGSQDVSLYHEFRA